MRRYRLIAAPKDWPEHLDFRLHFPEGDVGIGEEFEKELTDEEEYANVSSGLLEVVPSQYEIVGPNEVLGHAPGEKAELALTSAHEAQLVAGGHIARLEEPPKPTRKRKADREG